MLKNFIKIAFRSLIKNKGNSVINILGLSVGLALFLLVTLFVYSEINYDAHFSRADDIYRIAVSFDNGDMEDLASVPLPLAPAIKEEIPEVEESVRLVQKGGALFTAGSKKIIEDHLYYADPGFSAVFDLNFIHGKEDLLEPDKIALSKALSEKYFGGENPLGKIITVNNTQNLIVTGVFNDIPKESHFAPTMLISFSTIKSTKDSSRVNNWNSIGSFYTYVLLKPNASKADVNKKLSILEEKYYGEEAAVWNYFLQPLKEIHLYSNMGNEIGPSGGITYIYIFFTVSFFILLLACINYINISILKYSARAKEIGVRKTLGASKSALVQQFLIENFITTGISIIGALALVEVLLPSFNEFTRRSLSLNIFGNIDHLLIVSGIYILISFLSGLYPALYLSSLKPVHTLKNLNLKKRGKLQLKHALVVFQFAVSVILITGTMTSYSQLNFIKGKDLGYDKEHLLVIPMRDSEIINKSQALRNELLKVSRVTNVSFISDLPEGSFSTHSYNFEGRAENESVNIATYRVGDDFLQTMKIKLVLGNDFNTFASPDKENIILVNEYLVKKFGLDEPVGKRISIGGEFLTITGVVKDFNFMSLRENIEPLILRYIPSRTAYALVRISPGDHIETIKNVEESWDGIFPLFPLEHFFLDDRVNDMYQSENKMMSMNLVLSVIAIFIACLGLFALASYIVQQRTKEIGVRKVLGASVSNITMMISKEFLKLIIIAFVISIPAAYFLMSKWLQRYVFRIEMDAWLFIIPGIIIFTIALLTVSAQAIKAAGANPVESLRYE